MADQPDYTERLLARAQHYINTLHWSLIPIEPGGKRPAIVREPDGTPVWRKLKTGDPVPGGYQLADDGFLVEEVDDADPETMDSEERALVPWHQNYGWQRVPGEKTFQRVPMRYGWLKHQNVKATMSDVRSWLTRFGPKLNLGVVTGQISGIVVMDIDGDEGMESVVQHRPDTIAIQTMVQKTPRGNHCIFKHPMDRKITGSPGILPKVDIRADGNYVVIDPSWREEGEYRVLWEEQIAPCPQWIVDNVKLEPVTGDFSGPSQGNYPKWVSDLLRQGAPQGTRNQTATKLAGYFHNYQLPEDVMWEIMRTFGERCTPPYSERELRGVIRWANRQKVNARTLGISKPPLVIPIGDGFKFEFINNIQVEITYVDADRMGVSGEILVTTDIPGFPRELYGPVRLDLLKQTEIRGLITACQARMSGPKWNEIIDTVARLTVKNVREGDPIMKMIDAIPPPGDGVAIDPPILLSANHTLWFADGSGGKSLLALAAAATLEFGRDIGLGMLPKGQFHICYLDWEWEAYEHNKRLIKLLADLHPECSIEYKKMTVPLAQAAPDLRREFAKKNINYVIIDSATPACGGEPEASKPVMEFFAALNSFKMGSLILAHIVGQRSADDNARNLSPYGNVQWKNQCRSMWNIQSKGEPGESTLELEMYNRKANNGLERPVGYRITFGESHIHLQRTGAEGNGAMSSPNAYDAIMFALKKGAMTLDELAKKTEISDRTVRWHLNKAMEKKRVRMVIDGTNGKTVERFGLVDTHHLG